MEFRYLGSRFGMRPHGREGGFSTHLQQEYDSDGTELAKRLGWSKVLTFGKDGLTVEVMREFYISCI
jgi:hypothetical protein